MTSPATTPATTTTIKAEHNRATRQAMLWRLNASLTFIVDRDLYGFSVRPQLVQRYLEYANIYKEEEEERSCRWNDFLERQAESAGLPINDNSLEEGKQVSHIDVPEDGNSESQKGDRDNLHKNKSGSDSLSEDDDTEKEKVLYTPEKRDHRTKIWTEIRPSLWAIEDMMSDRVNKKGSLSKEEQETGQAKPLSPVEDARVTRGASEEDSEDEFYDADHHQDAPSIDSIDPIRGAAPSAASTKSLHPWKEELEVLVRGGVPMTLRGEIWQAFVGVRTRRVENYYQDLLANETSAANNTNQESFQSDSKGLTTKSICGHEKWKEQIEKDLPRTFPGHPALDGDGRNALRRPSFPGHPALDGDGRNALRRLLTAYARHNPSVGYCQAMNFFAALLLLLMPEENAFWTLMGIIDEYFDGYFSEEMIESQVDQLVFEELVLERFPKFVNHLDHLGVQVAWVTAPWFLSIFMNMLPWESGQIPDGFVLITVLRIWDVFLFEGNRVMLFRTALALIEFYGPALLTTKDAGDAVTLLQSLVSSTFDSSQLVLTACMGYQNVNEQALYSDSINVDEVLSSSAGDAKPNPVPDLQQQAVGLKARLCRLLEEKSSAVFRSEALETALMEMVKQDNRRQLSARVEQLEQEVDELREALSQKLEQENGMLQVLMRVEQDQKETEDARMFAEQDAAGQRYSVEVLQEKYEEAITKLDEMEKRVVLAESMLEATLQFQSRKSKNQPSLSPRSSRPDSPLRKKLEISASKINLLARPFVANLRDMIKFVLQNLLSVPVLWERSVTLMGSPLVRIRISKPRRKTQATENNCTDPNAHDTEVQGKRNVALNSPTPFFPRPYNQHPNAAILLLSLSSPLPRPRSSSFFFTPSKTLRLTATSSPSTIILWTFNGGGFGNASRSIASRCISSFPTPQPEMAVDWNEAVSSSEVGDGAVEEVTKRSIPVRAYFFSTSVDLTGLVEQNKQNFIPPTSRMTNYGPGVFISGSDCCFMVVFQYGSIVMFNVRECDVDQYLKIVEKHASGLLPEMRKDEYEFLNIDGIRTIGSVLGQSIALDYYVRQIVGKANSNLADVILKLGHFERSDIAWKDAKYAIIWEFLRDEFELTQRFASLVSS
ncbi:putative plastid-lipid-associated protein 12 [Hibiscus syriacus]|uniref:Plastid-lipid-associated protein 12 n=1 Tax=Hibiscus syriacus TaxID=106335 RepID=A0A6A3AI49_HIBSY|nr:putative plastid-lipid-associated protein 12 [Hibiscus syriacus]